MCDHVTRGTGKFSNEGQSTRCRTTTAFWQLGLSCDIHCGQVAGRPNWSPTAHCNGKAIALKDFIVQRLLAVTDNHCWAWRHVVRREESVVRAWQDKTQPGEVAKPDIESACLLP